MVRISSYQLFTITFLYQLGTTIIFGFAAGTGRDAWIVTILSSIAGMIIISMYLALMNMNPGLTLVEWFPKQFGKWIGIPIAWLYPLSFLFDAGRGVGALRDLVPTTLLPKTPPVVIVVAFLLVLIYGLYLGIENVARLGEILTPIILTLFGLEIVLLLNSHIIEFKLLLPVLWDGWAPVLKSVYPEGINQTYGESIALAMIWTLAKPQKKVWRITMTATILASIFFLLSDVLAITVFGDAFFKRSIYPLYSLTGMVNIGGFITNLNPFVVVYFISTTFIKLYIKLYAALLGFKVLLKLSSIRPLIWPAAACTLLIGFTISTNIINHIYVMAVRIITPYVWVPLFMVIPAILLLVTWIRRKAGI
ncbi:spore gernimation protein [Paenibacillus sp. FSL R7-0273]|uniref:GerAB/ArcD/ProY family transporter n=1 Tax=Paenibacillus sp. FSL R7-0273 TaxID=1536772 RepID=UPI0004F71032|nr:endospore germination permease [Paenibacillus sp. FSL R7-0273]AIQ47479.1 spore gernimation protein [Paenibacillus sp. FSL R7-0273]OMF95959.1 spore gernimation protein [Paenibacillus sp. FSL R7-0273]